ncbi:yabJ protein [Tirmania nivea]|nr:yabJ protein [Tirmania nivea]
MPDPQPHPLKTVVQTPLAPPPMPGILSQAIISGSTVYCSGSLGIDPKTSRLVGPGISERTAQALENIKNVLEAAGSGLDKIVKTTIYITDMDEYAAVNKAYEKAFRGTVVPARTCVAVYQLPLRSDVEIECIAHL